MKIWFDTHKIEDGIHSAECRECSGECSAKPSTSPKAPLDTDDLERIWTCHLQQATPLSMQACENERWLICNPVGSGQLAVVDAQALHLLEQFRTPTLPSDVSRKASMNSSESVEEIVRLFYRLGFLVDLHQRSTNQKDEVSTLSAWLHITNACNLRCHYCYLDKTNESMTDDIAQRSVDALLRSARKYDFKRITLKYAGGEASLNLTRVLAIHDYATQQAQQDAISLRASIFSNGVILSQRTIEEFKARQIGVTISLDGIGAYHDNQRPFLHGQASFRYVDRTISRLLANDVVPYISVTVSRRNLAGLPELMQYLLQHDLPFTISYYRDNECSTHIRDLQFEEEEMIAAMRNAFSVIEQHLPGRCLLGSLVDKANLHTMHDHTCGMGHNYLVIDQKGGIAKCHADIKQTVTTIDVEDPLLLIRNDTSGVQNYSVDEKEGCRTCDWRYWCSGGCPMLTYRMTGRSDIKSPNCNIYKALFPEVLRLEALRLLKYTVPITG
jgi:uncharacterized protein